MPIIHNIIKLYRAGGLQKLSMIRLNYLSVERQDDNREEIRVEVPLPIRILKN